MKGSKVIAILIRNVDIMFLFMLATVVFSLLKIVVETRAKNLGI